MFRILMLITALTVLLIPGAALAQKAPAIAGTWFAMLDQTAYDGLPDEKLVLSANGTGVFDNETDTPLKWKAENGRLTLIFHEGEKGEWVYEYQHVYTYTISGATLFLTREDNGRLRQYSKTAKQKAAFLNKATYPAVSVNTGSENRQEAAVTADGGKPVVYVSGNDDKGACYWKDGVKVSLHLAGEAVSQANAIAAAAGSVYVAGYYAQVNGGDWRACYWKDGVRTDLHYDGLIREGMFTSTDVSSEANAITVAENTVYVAGDYGAGVACYWKADAKNITRTLLYKTPASAKLFTASAGNGIAVLGNTVYTSGYYTGYPVMQKKACYWKDDKKTDILPKEFINSFEVRHTDAHKIAISGNSVHIAGFYDYYVYACACEEKRFYYWKDGVTTLIDEVNVMGSPEIAVSGNTVYIAGYYVDEKKSRACYWEGETRKDLDVPKNADNSSARPITVVDNIVYIAGHYNQNEKSIPCYWINGKRTDLPAAGTGGTVTGIAVMGGKK